jgi:hypothetical protein
MNWARTLGCPWNSQTLHHTRKSGRDDVYDWPIIHGCPQQASDDDFDDFLNMYRQ